MHSVTGAILLSLSAAVLFAAPRPVLALPISGPGIVDTAKMLPHAHLKHVDGPWKARRNEFEPHNEFESYDDTYSDDSYQDNEYETADDLHGYYPPHYYYDRSPYERSYHHYYPYYRFSYPPGVITLWRPSDPRRGP